MYNEQSVLVFRSDIYLRSIDNGNIDLVSDKLGLLKHLDVDSKGLRVLNIAKDCIDGYNSVKMIKGNMVKSGLSNDEVDLVLKVLYESGLVSMLGEAIGDTSFDRTLQLNSISSITSDPGLVFKQISQYTCHIVDHLGLGLYFAYYLKKAGISKIRWDASNSVVQMGIPDHSRLYAELLNNESRSIDDTCMTAVTPNRVLVIGVTGRVDTLSELNNTILEKSIEFIPVLYNDLRVYSGPYIRAGISPCYNCLVKRNSHFLEPKDDDTTSRLSCMLRGFIPTWNSIAASIISQFLYLKTEWNALDFYTHVYIHSVADLSYEKRKVLRNPRCSVCGILGQNPETNYATIFKEKT